MTFPSALLAVVVLVFASQRAQDTGASVAQLLSEIAVLHEQLATREDFQAQAKLLGVYLEEAKILPQQEKMRVYTTVLSIMKRISEQPRPGSPASGPATHPLPKPETLKEAEYESGAALVEVFKAGFIERMPELPTIRDLWKKALEHKDGFVVPGREGEIGRADYVLRLSFYFRAKTSGKHGFTFQMDGSWNHVRLIIDGSNIVDEKGGMTSSLQGIANMETGIHRIELYIGGNNPLGSVQPTFVVKVLEPGEFDYKLIARDRLLLKKGSR